MSSGDGEVCDDLILPVTSCFSHNLQNTVQEKIEKWEKSRLSTWFLWYITKNNSVIGKVMVSHALIYPCSRTLFIIRFLLYRNIQCAALSLAIYNKYYVHFIVLGPACTIRPESSG